MPNLISDKKKCKNCGVCERTLTGFKTKHDGCFFISWGMYRDSILVKESVRYIIDNCPGHAISLENA